MSNVVPFRPPLKYQVVTTLVDPNGPLKPGDIVAIQFINRDGKYGEVLFGKWYGPSGRDERGRFVRKGSPDETTETDFFNYTRPTIFRILGKVFAGSSNAPSNIPARHRTKGASAPIGALFLATKFHKLALKSERPLFFLGMATCEC